MSTNLHNAENFIRGLDPRAMPRYAFNEAASYLGIPLSTLRSWFVGMPYGTADTKHFFPPILKPASSDLLSFYDIASAHVLMALKAKGLKPEDVRDVVESLRKEYPEAEFPVLGRKFWMFGRDVVIKRLGKRLNLSESRQLGIKAVMDKFLARIELDANLMPIRFSPLRAQKPRARSFIVIDPELAYGRPVVRGTGIPAEIIAKRNKTGESVARLAMDYHITKRAVEEAISYFPKGKAA